MKKLAKLVFIAAGSLSLTALIPVDAQVLTQWTYEGLSTSGVNAGPATSTGSGTASTVGMSLFTGPEGSGIAKLAGTDTSPSNTSANNLTWKVRGSNGWNSAAAIGTQGAQFSVSTAGYTGITTSFDWYPSTTGEANLLIQYTTDGSTWINAPLADITIPTSGTLSLNTNTGSDVNTVTGAYINTTAGNTWYNTITLNLTGVSAANNDASFGFRLLNASTGADAVQATGGTALDNTKGNWSFDNVTVSGTVVPEPNTYALILGGALALFVIQFRRRNNSANKI